MSDGPNHVVTGLVTGVLTVTSVKLVTVTAIMMEAQHRRHVKHKPFKFATATDL
jgi:hypothetical protein